ncbi:MAG: biopolymer transporter ExbD [Lentisphaeria bacterium]|nr:biopolymer transporter ExbD [Candidatus Neomarinimicrobiota bacterium]MCF7842667.1 biopolymer transporter ExbD [Lentisphaeria bacterium]
MLLIFFMVVTVLRQYQGLKLILPEAKKISKLESKRHVTNIWVTKEGIISIDDRIMDMSQVRTVMYDKRVNDPQLTTSLKADRQSEMKLITGIHQELREADALKINYSAKTKN